jgi:hypothetical protein
MRAHSRSTRECIVAHESTSKSSKYIYEYIVTRKKGHQNICERRVRKRGDRDKNTHNAGRPETVYNLKKGIKKDGSK